MVTKVTTEDETIVKQFTAKGVTIGATAPEVPEDMHLGIIAWVKITQVNPVMTHHHPMILTNLKGLPPPLWKLVCHQKKMRMEAIDKTVNYKVIIVVIVIRLVVDIIASSNDEMMMVHQNRQIQVMMTMMEDHIDSLIDDIGSMNTEVVT